MAYRFTTVVVLFLLAFTYLGFHLYQLQLVKGDYYYAQAESEQSSAASNNGNRGGIYFTDNNGNTLPAAIDQPFPLIYAVPTAVKNPATAAATFAPILNISAAKLKAIFSRPGDEYELLVNKADPAVAQKVHGAEHSRRIYRDGAGAILPAGRDRVSAPGICGPERVRHRPERKIRIGEIL